RGQINEETYLRALANSLGVGFEPFFHPPSLLYPPGDDRLIKCIATGMLPMWVDDILALVVAPRNLAARRLTDLIGNRPELAEHLRFTTSARLNRFAVRTAGSAIAVHASDHLRERAPEMSAANARGLWCLAAPVVAALAGLAGPIFAPSVTTEILALMLSALFLASLGLRLGITVAAAPVTP